MITIIDPILEEEEYVVEVRYDDKKMKGGKQPSKVKSVKEYNDAIKDGSEKIREDYIHSFIDEHERGVEPEEEK